MIAIPGVDPVPDKSADIENTVTLPAVTEADTDAVLMKWSVYGTIA